MILKSREATESSRGSDRALHPMDCLGIGNAWDSGSPAHGDDLTGPGKL